MQEPLLKHLSEHRLEFLDAEKILEVLPVHMLLGIQREEEGMACKLCIVLVEVVEEETFESGEDILGGLVRVDFEGFLGFRLPPPFFDGHAFFHFEFI